MISCEAPKGKFRVIGVNTLDDTDWLEGDFDTLNDAKLRADVKGGQTRKIYVYDEHGKSVYDSGTF